ncbi:hypothetical protein GGF31_002554 [Allomyces arbusculus]|nr:hypothetical protein GGF31_002554 [Allomyces arbusculus]
MDDDAVADLLRVKQHISDAAQALMRVCHQYYQVTMYNMQGNMHAAAESQAFLKSILCTLEIHTRSAVDTAHFLLEIADAHVGTALVTIRQLQQSGEGLDAKVQESRRQTLLHERALAQHRRSVEEAHEEFQAMEATAASWGVNKFGVRELKAEIQSTAQILGHHEQSLDKLQAQMQQLELEKRNTRQRWVDLEHSMDQVTKEKLATEHLLEQWADFGPFWRQQVNQLDSIAEYVDELVHHQTDTSNRPSKSFLIVLRETVLAMAALGEDLIDESEAAALRTQVEWGL